MFKQQVPLLAFWPSRRLRLKFFLGLIYAPMLFSLVIFLLAVGLFAPSENQTYYLILIFLILVAGPISLGVLLLPTWRGAVAGILGAAGMILAWSTISYLVEDISSDLVKESLGWLIIAGLGVTIVELIVRDVRDRTSLVGLGLGLFIGFLLLLLYFYFFEPYNPKIDIPSGYQDLFGILGWAMQVALVWPSAFFFPEWISQKVGWGGLIVWMGLVAAVFGLSFILMK